MWPLIELAVAPKWANGQDRLNAVLARLTAEDPSFIVSLDAESGQTVLHGWDEPSLERTVALLTQDIALEVSAPQVAYRETITQAAIVDYSHKWVGDGKGQFARIKLLFEPGVPNSGFVFTCTAPPGTVPDSYVAGVAAGLEAASTFGLLAGFPVIDMKATLIDGAYHDRDSSALTFDIAARAAFKALRQEGGLVLLEPLVTVEVSAPETYLGGVAADLIAHRAEALERMDGKLTARVPLTGLLGYDRRLHGLTNGQGEWSMTFERYALVPQTPPDDIYTPDIGMRA